MKKNPFFLFLFYLPLCRPLFHFSSTFMSTILFNYVSSFLSNFTSTFLSTFMSTFLCTYVFVFLSTFLPTYVSGFYVPLCLLQIYLSVLFICSFTFFLSSFLPFCQPFFRKVDTKSRHLIQESTFEKVVMTLPLVNYVLLNTKKE